jgi:hypothetical protein
MPFSDERTQMEEKMEPLLAKSLRSMIRHKFITEYGYSDSVPVAEFITDDLMKLIQSVVFDAQTVKPGQLVWMAVEKEYRHKGYGVHLYDMPMKPVVLTFLNEDDINKHIQTKGREERLGLLRDRMARMLQESQEQVGPLAQSDLAAFFSYSQAMISQQLLKWQEEKDEILPYRGTVHDIGTALTHKTQAIERVLAGEPLSDVARALHHSLPDIERYYKDYNKVEMATTICDDVAKIALITNMSVSLVQQYYDLVEKHRPEKMLKYNTNSDAKNSVSENDSEHSYKEE